MILRSSLGSLIFGYKNLIQYCFKSFLESLFSIYRGFIEDLSEALLLTQVLSSDYTRKGENSTATYRVGSDTWDVSEK